MFSIIYVMIVEVMKNLKFESDCQKHRMTIERISLGCVAAVKAVRHLSELISQNFPENFSIYSGFSPTVSQAADAGPEALGITNDLLSLNRYHLPVLFLISH
jgi:hypothetical protein